MRTTCLISRQVGGRVVRTAAHGGAGKRETERIHRRGGTKEDELVGKGERTGWRRRRRGGGRVKGGRKGGSGWRRSGMREREY